VIVWINLFYFRSAQRLMLETGRISGMSSIRTSEIKLVVSAIFTHLSL